LSLLNENLSLFNLSETADVFALSCSVDVTSSINDSEIDW